VLDGPKPVAGTVGNRAFEALLAGPGKRGGMDVDRKTVVELAASTFVIVAFTAGAYVVSQSYASPRDPGANSSVPPSVEPAGGIALIATIALFILVVAVVGLFVYAQDFDEE